MNEVNRDDVVVLVGAGPGLGRSIATTFGRRGARVVLLARAENRLAELARTVADETGATIDPVVADATDEQSLQSAFAEIRRRHGEPTVLVHNPSLAVEAPPTQTSVRDMMDGLRLSVGSLLTAAHEVAPAMRAAGRGTILVTGSGVATTGSTWSATLATQKAAVRNLTLSLASELRGEGVQVCTVRIRGLLGQPGFELDRIAEEYVRLHGQSDDPSSWRPEVVWTGEASDEDG